MVVEEILGSKGDEGDVESGGTADVFGMVVLVHARPGRQPPLVLAPSYIGWA